MVPAIDSPIELPCGARLANRLCKAALTEGLADPMNRATRQLEHLYRRWSEGGAGLVITGNVQIDRTHLERPGNVVIDNNGGLDRLRAYAKAGTSAGNHLWMQINHPGRQTPKSLNANPLAPSAVSLQIPGDGFGEPRGASEAEILDLIRRFASVAAVARDSGFTGVQIHAAHGYLISQFLSPVANRRSDEWGGSLENRARFLLQITRAIRAAVGADFPIGVKLNSADFQAGGFSNEDAQRVVKWLGAEKIDLLELSGGTYEQLVMIGAGSEPVPAARVRDSTRRREAYFLEYASLIKPVANMPVMVTGGFRTKSGMEEALADGSADLIGLGRPMCIDPELPRRLLAGEVDRGTTWEHRLALAPDALGKDVAPALHRQIETWGKQGWFCLQLIRLGNGSTPDLDMSVLDAFDGYMRNEAQTAARLQRD
ncbi:MAG: NADH:flavin oxidoreductase/NADH oxidase family protein [Pseudomonadota bacterium]|nr:NADH:flavin oxidoreductase/NADH oxidase family protein [Pseudomonadota bacterium]